MVLDWLIIDGSGNPITGAAALTGLKCRRGSDGKLLDWADGTFKVSGWTTVSVPLDEADAVNLSGVYIKTIATTGWADGRYKCFSAYAGTPAQYGVTDDLYVKNEQLLEEYMAATTPVSVLPFCGSIQASYAQSGATVEVIQGDSPSIPYDLATNLTDYTIWFGVKKDLADTAYAIAVKEITASITDVLNGRGTIPLTTAETNLAPGAYAAEVEIRKALGVLTAMRFTLKIKGQVITP